MNERSQIRFPAVTEKPYTLPGMMMSHLNFDVINCVARVLTQDQEAARSLVRYLYPTVIGIVRRRLPRRAAEEDLAQEIFVKVFEKLDQYKGEVPIIHWVLRIAMNHCLNAIRSQRAWPEWRMADLSDEQQAALDLGPVAMEQPHPACAIGSQELVGRILERLNPKDRVIVRMLDLEELSVEDVQRATGWSAAYIRLRAFRARQKLNRRFGRLKEEGCKVQ